MFVESVTVGVVPVGTNGLGACQLMVDLTLLRLAVIFAVGIDEWSVVRTGMTQSCPIRGLSGTHMKFKLKLKFKEEK
jgi:hypothetical protein